MMLDSRVVARCSVLALVFAWGCAGTPAKDDDTGPADTDETDVADTDVADTDVADTDVVDTDDSDVSETLVTVVLIPAGTFTMGCVAGRDDVAGGCGPYESPSHSVTLTRSFWMMEAEVTQAQYAAVVGTNPSYFSGSNLPVESVSWDEAVAFADAVSVAQGLTPCGSGDPYTCDGWRLPTEAEWEYAARGGEAFPYAGSSSADSVAWYGDNSGAASWDGSSCGGQACTHSVCTKARNGFGLCDMSGNVWEWTWDWQGTYPAGSVVDPQGPASGSFRVFRGGGWINVARDVRVARRSWFTPGSRASYLGFRLVRSVP